MSGLIRRGLHLFQRAVPRVKGGVTILGYHLVGADEPSCINLPLDAFRAQMEELTEIARVTDLAEALERLSSDEPIREHLVVLTFDDGYRNFYTKVWPVLRDLGFPSTLYAQVDFIKGNGTGPIADLQGLDPLTWDQLIELANSGLVTVGSHTCSHPSLRSLDSGLMVRELEDSKQILQERLGQPIESFCYPRGQWSRKAENEVKRHYKSAVIRGGRNMRPTGFSPYRLERVPIRTDMPTSLENMVGRALWLEEWFAANIRHVLPSPH